MLKIYHAPGTRGWRTIWACEEIAHPYEVVQVDFSASFRESDEWRALNPVGKVPVMTDGDFVLFESGAMVQYVLDRYGKGKLQPTPGTEAHALYMQWSWFAEATFARPLGEIVNHKRAFKEQAIQTSIDEMTNRSELCMQALNDALQNKTYLLGEEFSAADIMMGYTLRIYKRLVSETMPEHVSRYWSTLQSRAGFQATEAADKRGL